MIDKPVPGVQTDTRPHPAGAKGAHISLKEVADRAWKARMSPRLKAWTQQQLAAAGVLDGGTRRQKAQAVLDAFRKKVPYIADPVMGEFMATPNQTLCLDEGGLCFMAGDCDDHSVGLAAAMMSIGIPTMIIGASYHDPIDIPSHVFMAFQGENDDWIKMDGTTKLPAGKTQPSAREFWYEPGKAAKESGEGDFVGMAGAPGTLAAPPRKAASLLDLQYPGIR